MYKTLRDKKIRVSSEMKNNLQLLHSYNIIKVKFKFLNILLILVYHKK